MNEIEKNAHQGSTSSFLKMEQVREQAEAAAHALVREAGLKLGQLVVIGCSTSEVAGARIGTSGATDTAQAIFAGLDVLRSSYGLELAFQCCEHLNRALVVERHTLDRLRLVEVSAVPVRKAGGSMAAYAYRHLTDACLAEEICAHAGIDIGETLIGMHLRRVAVPLRTEVRYIGKARVNMAKSRPKLIGGERAVYQLPTEDGLSSCE